MTGIQITSVGTALPDNVVTNNDLAKTLDTSDEWIRERTGIKERRIGGPTWELGAEAGREALKRANVEPTEIDAFILATSSPYRRIPATSAKVSELLNLKCGSFDLNAACAGFVYGLVLADGMMKQGNQKILLMGAENISSLMDLEDRSTAVLFGDGAGAVVIEAVPQDQGSLLGYDLVTEGSLEHILYCEHDGFIKMEGKEVFRQAVTVTTQCSTKALEKAGLTIEDVDIMIPHQANSRIINAACTRLGFPQDKTVDILSWTGNTSTASVPLALSHALEEERINKGDIILFVGFGAGMSAAAAIVRW